MKEFRRLFGQGQINITLKKVIAQVIYLQVKYSVEYVISILSVEQEMQEQNMLSQYGNVKPLPLKGKTTALQNAYQKTF